MKNKLILSVLLVNLLAACGSNPPKAVVADAKPAPVVSAPAVAAPVTSAVNQPSVDQSPVQAAEAKAIAAEAVAARVEADPNASAAAKAKAKADADVDVRAAAEAQALAKHSVFFPFDVDAVQPADLNTIQAHAQNLASNPNLKVRVEGNADERGSSEYNLALGQRRANNTKKALVLGGARSDQIEAISYGEEKPLATGHDEASWAQNRRADIDYTK